MSEHITPSEFDAIAARIARAQRYPDTKTMTEFAGRRLPDSVFYDLHDRVNKLRGY